MAKAVQEQKTAYDSRKMERRQIQVRQTVYEDGEFVEKILDPLEPPLKVQDSIDVLHDIKGRSGLTIPQFFAAQAYQEAYEAQFASLGGSMDFERVRGQSGLPPMSPADHMVWGAAKIKDANDILRAVAQRDPDKKLDVLRQIDVLERIAGRGYTIEQCARQIYKVDSDRRVSGRIRQQVSEVLKGALDALALQWYGKPNDGTKSRTWGERPTGVDPAAFSPGRTSHYDQGRAYSADEVRANLSGRKRKGKRA